jgi:ferrous iron transport protein B
MDWIDSGVSALSDFTRNTMAAGPLRDLITDGILGGVGAVIVFLPQILILYFFISLMEESGYMARAAFIMDKIMHKMGLHGKSFIPLIMGFGCNVPAVMATRTIESRKSRLITMLVLPLMSCSARLPVYLIITGIFFAHYQGLIILLMYAIGIMMSVLVARLFSMALIKGDDTPFVMELPPYRMPTAKAIFRHTWEKGRQYLKKMGGIILTASIVIWFLGYYPNHNAYSTTQQQQEHSYLGMIGKGIEPALRPCGFDWKMGVGLISGAGAKELVASTMGILYSNNAETDSTQMATQIRADGITALGAFCYLLFVLIYFPCIATISAIKNESGHWKWALFAAGYTTLLAWCVSFVVYQIGGLLV